MRSRNDRCAIVSLFVDMNFINFGKSLKTQPQSCLYIATEKSPSLKIHNAPMGKASKVFALHSSAGMLFS